MLPGPKQPLIALAAGSVAVFIAFSALPLEASGLQTQTANVNSGTYAARLTVSKTCTAGNATVPDGSCSSDPGQDPCGTLTANDVDVSGNVTFRAGDAVQIGSGFSVASGSTFTVQVGGGIIGDSYLGDDSPSAEKEYVVRFYIDPDGLSLSSESEEFRHFVAYDAAGKEEFLIGLTWDDVGMGGEKRLFVTAFESGNVQRTTKNLCELVVGTGWQYIEAHWKASTGTDGDVDLSIDGAAPQSLVQCLGMDATGLDNGGGEISSVEWGASDLAGSSSLGTLDMDDFESRKAGAIGGI